MAPRRKDTSQPDIRQLSIFDTDELVDPQMATEHIPPLAEFAQEWRMRAYREYAACAGPSPLKSYAGPARLAFGLLSILEDEAPMTVRRLFDVYLRGCGLHKLGSRLQTLLTEGLQHALKTRRCLVVNESDTSDLLQHIVRLPSQPEIIVRLRGPRTLEEIPPSELLAVAGYLEYARRLAWNSEAHRRALLHEYELMRLTDQASAWLDHVLALERPAVHALLGAVFQQYAGYNRATRNGSMLSP